MLEWANGRQRGRTQLECRKFRQGLTQVITVVCRDPYFSELPLITLWIRLILACLVWASSSTWQSDEETGRHPYVFPSCARDSRTASPLTSAYHTSHGEKHCSRMLAMATWGRGDWWRKKRRPAFNFMWLCVAWILLNKHMISNPFYFL